MIVPAIHTLDNARVQEVRNVHLMGRPTSQEELEVGDSITNAFFQHTQKVDQYGCFFLYKEMTVNWSTKMVRVDRLVFQDH